MWAQNQGVCAINPMNTGGTVDLGAFRVSLTQAHHSSSSSPAGMQPIYLGNPNGAVIEANGEPTLYHAGDTDIFGDMALIQEFFKPDIGVLPIGDCFTMGGKKAALATSGFLRLIQ